MARPAGSPTTTLSRKAAGVLSTVKCTSTECTIGWPPILTQAPLQITRCILVCLYNPKFELKMFPQHLQHFMVCLFMSLQIIIFNTL